MKYDKFSRRMFLQGAGQLLPMPFLVSLLPRELWAQSATTVRRYVGVSTNYDYGKHSAWFPTSAQPSQKLNPGDGDRTLSYQALSSYLSSSSANLSMVLGNYLNPYVGQMNLIRGLDWSTRIAHGAGHVFGNFAANDGHETSSGLCAQIPTIDQVLRRNTQFNSINKDVAVLGFRSRSYRRDTSGTVTNAPIISEYPTEVFRYLFNNGNLPESTGTPGTTTAHPRANLMNGVIEDYRRVRDGRQISSADKMALNNAMDLLADISRGLQGTTTPAVGSCRYKDITPPGGGVYFMSESTMTVYARMIVAAIMCDVTRVFMWNCMVNEDFYDQNPTDDFHHGYSHIPFTSVNGNPAWRQMALAQQGFIRGFMAPLLNGLASATDPLNGKSYLYNSLVHYTIETSQCHGLNSQPTLLAGNAGGNLTSGYLLDYTDRNRIHPWSADGFTNAATAPNFSEEWVGIPVNRVFNTVLQSMGLAPADYESSAINQHFAGRSDGRFGANNNGLSPIGGYGHWGPPSSGYGNGYFERAPLFDLRHFKKALVLPANSV